MNVGVCSLTHIYIYETSWRTKRLPSPPEGLLKILHDSGNRWHAGRDVCHFCHGVLSKKQLEYSSSSQQRAHPHGRSQHWVIDWSACLLQQPATSSPRCCITKGWLCEYHVSKINARVIHPWKWRSLTDLGVCFVAMPTGKGAALVPFQSSFFSLFNPKVFSIINVTFQLSLPDTLSVTTSSEGLHFYTCCVEVI